MKVEICMGTACHLRGSREVIENIQRLISENNLKDDVELSGKFCLGQCDNKGVSVTVDGVSFDLDPSQTQQFFTKEIKGRIHR